MKRLIIIILLPAFLFLLPLQNANAQQDSAKSREEMRKELDEFKMKFIAQEIDLKDNQKEQFVELYSKMNAEKRKVFSNAMKLERKLRHSKDATESEYAAASKAMAEAKVKDQEIERRFDEKFSAFLSSKQIFQMKIAEEKFRRKMESMRGKKHRPSSKPKPVEKGKGM